VERRREPRSNDRTDATPGSTGKPRAAAWTDIREDHRGLYVEGKLAKGVAKASEVQNAVSGGKLPDGSKIIVRQKSDEGSPTLEFQIGESYIKVRYD
jgi:hypothetical protein